MQYKLEGYQKAISDLIVKLPYVGIFARMGCGKTLATLHSLFELMYNRPEVEHVLVIAPKRVAQYTWTQEIEKWGFPFTVAVAVGSKQVREDAVRAHKQITIINRENVPWLVKNNPWYWDMVVIDESSSFKSYTSLRFKALKAVKGKYSRCVLLTGTPAPRGYQNLWSQIYLLDRGKRLGVTITKFRQDYLYPKITSGAIVYQYELRAGAKEEIDHKLSDICFGLTDDTKVKSARVVDITAQMDDKTKKLYKKFKQDQVVSLGSEEITAVTAGVLSNKLLQFASGSVYTKPPHYYVFHRLKLDLLHEIIDSEDGQNILVFYNYKHERERIMEEFPDAEDLDVDKWQNGQQRLALAHPASCGHGLNLQSGGSICVWFSLTFDLELYEQANARLDRKGQTEDVTIYRLLVEGTRDMDVVKALEKKGYTQNEFINSLKLELDMEDKV